MTITVKICGLSEPETLQVAQDAGADFIGFVFFPKSPRNVSIQQAKTLISNMSSKARSVALCVNPDDDLLDAINTQANPDWFQLHGKETPERVAEIKKRIGKPVMKAIGVAEQADIETAMQYQDCTDLLLFDAKPPADGKSLPGGNGLPFDWTLLKKVENDVDYMLSGGLNPENVQAAIELTGARAVDVSSGVETGAGVKDPDLIRKFIAAARSVSA